MYPYIHHIVYCFIPITQLILKDPLNYIVNPYDQEIKYSGNVYLFPIYCHLVFEQYFSFAVGYFVCKLCDLCNCLLLLAHPYQPVQFCIS